MTDALSEKEVQITISEPWDFRITYGENPIFGKILKIGESIESKRESLLIKLDKPVDENGISYQFMRASVREVGPYNELTKKLKNNEFAWCNLLALTEETANSENPFFFDFKKHPDYFGMIGTLELVRPFKE